MLNIVLHEPEMPANTGNIGRTCVAAGARLHLIEPLGFQINEKQLKRAGLDYWDKLDVTIYDDFNDFLEYMGQIKNMGGLSSLINMIPGVGGQIKDDMLPDEKQLGKIEAIIFSMTKEERGNPDLINPSRKRRIANGAGVDISEVNKLVKQFEQARKMMKNMPGMMGGRKKRGGFKMPFGF